MSPIYLRSARFASALPLLFAAVAAAAMHRPKAAPPPRHLSPRKAASTGRPWTRGERGPTSSSMPTAPGTRRRRSPRIAQATGVMAAGHAGGGGAQSPACSRKAAKPGTAGPKHRNWRITTRATSTRRASSRGGLKPLSHLLEQVTKDSRCARIGGLPRKTLRAPT